MTTDYNGASWTAAELIAAIRRKASIPDSASDFTDAVLYEEASECLWSFAGFAMQQASDGRLSFSLTRSITSDVRTSDSDEVELPPFAAADSISSVAWISGSGSEKALARVSVDQEVIYDDPDNVGEPWAFCLLDGRLRLIPRPSDTAGSLRISYPRRHGALVAAEQLSTVQSIATVGAGATCTITMAGTTTHIDTGSWIDVVAQYYPYRTLLADVKVTNKASTVLTLDLPYATLNAVSPVNMRLIPSGRSAFVQLPLELKQPFTEYATAAILRQIGDEGQAQAYEQSAREGLGRATNMLNPRTKATREKIINPNSLLRGGVGGRMRWSRETW